jgi:hypothetical protein
MLFLAFAFAFATIKKDLPEKYEEVNWENNGSTNTTANSTHTQHLEIPYTPVSVERSTVGYQVQRPHKHNPFSSSWRWYKLSTSPQKFPDQ